MANLVLSHEDIDFGWNLGPDTLCPASSLTATKLDEAVQLRVDKELIDEKPVSTFTQFKNIVDKIPNHPALATEDADGKWTTITYDSYWKLCLNAAKSFINIGLKPHNCVAIIGFNAPQWLISLHGTIFAGGIGCGIYTTNSAEACEYVLKDSGARIVVVENQVHLDKILKCRETCQIDQIIQYTGEIKDSYDGLIITWEEFLKLSDNITDNQLQNRVSGIAPNKCATLIYTSGTTGQPKAAMISHDNICFASKYILVTANVAMHTERVVSYLPLSHIAAQLIDCFITIFAGATLYFARPDVFKGTLTKTLSYAKPTLFFAVPRVWEKLEEKIASSLANLSKTKALLFNWATRSGIQYIQSCFQNQARHKLRFKIADKLVLSKVRKLLGLHRAKMVYSGAAPINKHTLEFFMGLGFPICEVFGMSECTGPHVIGLPTKNCVSSVGYCKNNFSITKILNEDDQGNGELCIYSRNVFMGYLNSPSKTQETIDVDGYLHTGDISKVDNNGFLFITGRLKELIITAGGENVAPVPIEEAVKEELSSFVSNCMVIGDNKKYLTILITLKSQINLDTLEPLDELTEDCIKHLQKINSKATKTSQIIEDKSDPLYEVIDEGIKRANLKAVSNVAKVKKFTILPRDFSIPTGELGNTFKLRRLIVTAKYADLIEAMYNDENNME